MKRRKIKLFASVASFALVAAVMSFGVFAATSHTIGVTSQLGFSATGISGTLVATTSGAQANKTSETLTITPLELTQSSDNEGANTAVDFSINVNKTDATLALGALEFTEAGADITYTFTITNATGATNAIKVTTFDVYNAANADDDTAKFTDLGTKGNIEADITVPADIQPGQHADVSVKFSIVDKAVTVTDFQVFFNLVLSATPVTGA